MRNFILFVSLIMGNITLIYAQNIVSGKVTNPKNEALAGCHIHANSHFAIADADGNFKLNLPSGKTCIVLSYVGFKSLDTLIDVSHNMHLNFQLKEDIALLAEVVVKDKSVKTNATAHKNTLKSDKIEKYSGNSLGDALREISGISSLKTGNTIVKPVINGLHSSRVVIINNNVRLEDQQWGLEHAPNLDINTAEKISVIKGVSGLQYGGDAIGGVVIIEPNSVTRKDTIYGKTILNGVSNGRGGSITSSLSQNYQSGWHWNVQGTLKYLGDFESPDYILSNTGNQEKNFAAGLGYKGINSGFSAYVSYFNARIGILKASHIGNISDLINAINNNNPITFDGFSYHINAPKQEVKHYLGKMNYYKSFSDWGKITLQYAFQFNDRLEYDIRRGDTRNKPSLDLNLTTHSFLADFETLSNTSSKYKIGMNGVLQNNFANTQTGVRPLIPDFMKLDWGIYGMGSFALTDKLEFEAGIRYDFSKIDATKFYLKSRWNERNYQSDFSQIIIGEYGSQWKTNPVFTYHNFSGSLGTKYQVNQNLKWFVNLGLASRNPNPSELFSDGLHHSTGQIELGDLRLQKETAFKISTVLSYSSDKIAFEINPYLHFINNFTLLQPTGLEQTLRGAFPVWEYKQVQATLAGIDWSFSHDFARNFNYQSRFSFLYGTNNTHNIPLIDMPPTNWSNTIEFKKQSWNNLTLGLTSEVIFTQNRFPDYDFSVNVPVNGEMVSEIVAISQPPKGYHLLHFNSQIRFLSFAKSAMTIGFNIQNIFNTNYRDYLNRTRFYADDLGRNFNIQIKYNY